MPETAQKETIFCIDKGFVQDYAEQKLGRLLTDDELRWVGKGIDSALCHDLDVVLDTAIEEAIRP